MRAASQQQCTTSLALPWHFYIIAFIAKYLSIVTWKCCLPGGSGILILTAVWAFSACEQNNWIILEVILLFRRLTRTVQTVSGERVCLKGLEGSACLEMGCGVLTDPNTVNRGWCDVWQRTSVGSLSCDIRTRVSGGGPSRSGVLLTFRFGEGYGGAQLGPFWYTHVLHLLQLWSHITSASTPLAFHIVWLCLFFVKINLRAILSSQPATQRDTRRSSLRPHAMMNVQRLASPLPIQRDTKQEEAFNTHATICITWNCHFARKWMCWGWDRGRDWDAPELAGGSLDRCGPRLLSPWRDGQWAMGEGLKSCGPAGAAWTRPVFPLAEQCVNHSPFHAEVERAVVSPLFQLFWWSVTTPHRMSLTPIWVH